MLAGHTVQSMNKEELLDMACAIEGHPDNVAPALYGDIQLGVYADNRWMFDRINTLPGMQCVCFIPNCIGKTSIARGVLSDSIDRNDAVFNIGRVALLINSLHTNKMEKLRWTTEDAMHQPQRGIAMYPHMQPLISAALEAGACAAFLSGSGPTITALTSGASGDIFTQQKKERVDQNVAAAMIKVAHDWGMQGNCYISAPTREGGLLL